MNAGVDFVALGSIVDLVDDAAALFAGADLPGERREAAVEDLGQLFDAACVGLALVRDGDLAAGIAGIGECRIYETLARLAGGEPEAAIGAAARAFAAARAGTAIEAGDARVAARALGEIARRIRSGRTAW